jgi:hypothetical protein
LEVLKSLEALRISQLEMKTEDKHSGDRTRDGIILATADVWCEDSLSVTTLQKYVTRFGILGF